MAAVGLVVSVAGVLGVEKAASAVSVVTIGNGTQSSDGTYVNAQNIADGLTVTNINITGDNRDRDRRLRRPLRRVRSALPVTPSL